MQRPIIAVDVDEVLAAYAKGFIQFSNARWGTNLTIQDYDEDWSKVWQIDRADVPSRVAALLDSRQIVALDHDVSALDVLRHLKESYDLIIVTARQTQMKGDTLAWVSQRFPGIFEEDKIFFAGIWDVLDETSRHKTKGQMIKDLGVSYLIDDQLKHCLSVQQQGLQALLFGDYAWNQATEPLPRGVTRVHNWSEVREFFDAQAL